MKKITHIACLILGLTGFSQEEKLQLIDVSDKYETIICKEPKSVLKADKNWTIPSDTIIIKGDFMNEKYELKKAIVRYVGDRKLNIVTYSFFVEEKDPLGTSLERTELRFAHRKYANSDQHLGFNSSSFFEVNKNYIISNKENIITLKNLKEMGGEHAIWFLNKAKNIYLIDTSLDNEGVIKMNKVFFMSQLTE